MSELIHTCYRIGDIDRSVSFYEKLGFEETGRFPIRDEAINVFMGLPGDGARLELTYNHGVSEYTHGTGYNHIALTVSNMEETLAGRFTVVCPDLRGYGQSSKPPTTPDHEPYSKRARTASMSQTWSW